MDKEKEYIEFEEGVFGFEDHKRFIPVMLEEGSDAVLYLQSAEDEDLSFIIMNPFLLVKDYEPVLGEEDYEKLGTSCDEDLSYYVVCVVRDKVEDCTVNLKCPIVVNHVTRKARQVILDSEKYGLRHLLKEFTSEEAPSC